MKLTPITNPLALHLDTTVGTRIFAGDTMIYGDTGIRLLADSDYGTGWGKYSASAALSVWVRRVNNTVHFGGYLTKTGDLADNDTVKIPIGFRPNPVGHPFLLHTTLGVNASAALPQSVGTLRLNTQLQPGSYIYAPTSFVTNNPWPTTLPGTPA